MENYKLKRLLFPDSLFIPDQLSFSTLLYFNDGPIYSLLHPTVSLLMTGCDPFKFFEIVRAKNPGWFPYFDSVFNVWYSTQMQIHETTKILEPLRENCLRTIWLSYPRTEEVLNKNMEIVNTSQISCDNMLNIIDFPMACHEFISHVLFEKFLETYEGEIPNSVQQGEALKGSSYKELRLSSINYEELYNYLDQLLKMHSFEELLAACYFFRVSLIRHFNNVLLTNERLMYFFDKLPIKNMQKDSMAYEEKIDVVGWELFRQLTSKYIDNYEITKRIRLIESIRNNSNEELNNLIQKCQRLAQDFSGETDPTKLSNNIAKYIKVNVEKEIDDLLKFKKYQFNELFDDLFSDEKTWLAISSMIVSTFCGGSLLLTAGSALAAFSNIAAKSFKVAASMDEKIKNSDYALIYRISKV